MLARYGSLAIFLLLVVAAAVAGGSFEAGEWYFQKLNKPSWAPPAWLFGPAWAVTYLFMALAAWHVWLTGHYSRLGALIWWGFLLVLNISWFALFFGIHRPGWAWLELSFTMVVAVLCIRAFRLVSRQAAYLMVPYVLWALFIWAFNLAAWSRSGGPFSQWIPG